jgi:hypothetical protein
VPSPGLDSKTAEVAAQVQTEVERSFSSIPDSVPDGITRIDNASGARTYTVVDTDRHVVCITNGGPLTVSIPTPATKRTLGIIANGPNPVTVQRSDGAQMSFGASVTLANEASLFVSDGTDWYLG